MDCITLYFSRLRTQALQYITIDRVAAALAQEATASAASSDGSMLQTEIDEEDSEHGSQPSTEIDEEDSQPSTEIGTIDFIEDNAWVEMGSQPSAK